MDDDALSRRRAAVLAMLPEEVRRATEARDIAGLKAALAALPPEAVPAVVGQLRDVGILAGGEDRSAVTALVEDFAPLLADIVAVASGNDARRGVVEQVVAGLAQVGWQLQVPVAMLWDGERDPDLLTANLEDEEIILVRRILELLAAP
jgi:hypothetical protein